MNYQKIMNKLNEKNISASELLICPCCGSTDVIANEEVEDIYYYRETDLYRYVEEYEGQRPIGIDIVYICDHCDTNFRFTGKLTDTKIEKIETI